MSVVPVPVPVPVVTMTVTVELPIIVEFPSIVFVGDAVFAVTAVTVGVLVVDTFMTPSWIKQIFLKAMAAFFASTLLPHVC